jgi:hypothetical protein
MVYNAQNVCVSGLCPSFGILNDQKINVSELKEKHTLLGALVQ